MPLRINKAAHNVIVSIMGLPPLQQLEVKTKRVHGRPSKRKNVFRLSKEPSDIDRGFYLRITKLKTKEDVNSFLKEHPFFSTQDNAGGPKKANAEDVFKLKEDLLRLIGKSKMRGSTYSFLDFDSEDLNIVNGYLSKCFPRLELETVTTGDLHPSEKEEFNRDFDALNKRDIRYADFTLYNELVKNYAQPRNIIREEQKRKGGTFRRLIMRCNNSASACFYAFLTDLLAHEHIRICFNCSRTFIADKNNQFYCKNMSCIKERGRKRVALTRQNPKLSSQ